MQKKWAGFLLFLTLAGCGRPEFRTGLEVLIESELEPLRGRKVGVVTNQTGVDRRMVSIIDLLATAESVQLVAIFGPEHGTRGSAQAGEKVKDSVDPGTGVPVFSLYGETRKPTREMLEGIELILFDIQDIGVRPYTYLSTLVEVLEAAAGEGLEVWVLDRPVPIGADRFEGPILQEAFRSFVGSHFIPLRHGLTAGEFALMVNSERSIDARLNIVKMAGYRRGMDFAETGQSWVAPSPNIPTVDTALIYAGMVLIEGTNLSEGRGTTRPFHLIGAPWIDGRRLAAELNRVDLAGVIFREARFTPAVSKYRGEDCRGVEIHLTDRRAYQPVTTAIALLSMVRELHPDRLTFRESFFDRLAGSAGLRTAISTGTRITEIMASWEDDLRDYRERRARYLLYD